MTDPEPPGPSPSASSGPPAASVPASPALPRSPLAPESFPLLVPVAGVGLASVAAGIRGGGVADLWMAELAEGTAVAGVFTRSACPSAPVDWCKGLLAAGTAPRALVCNSGNANAFTGSEGRAACVLTAELAAAAIGADPERVCLASTGVIGEQLPVEALREAIPAAAEALEPSGPQGWHAAADAIRTTDTFAKGACSAIEGCAAQVVGIAKGSGMIAPDMATMLAFVFTDLAVERSLLQGCLESAVAKSFNRISVDGDTSTSDTVLAFATGEQIDDAVHDASDRRLPAFQAALDSVCVDLARQVVRDGEGATKFVEIAVTGAADDEAARKIAFAIGNSPLVKTALAASDANWGRIVMAVGKSGQAADRDRLAIRIGDEQVAEAGTASPGYSEQRATEHLRGSEVRLAVDVGVGDGASVIWTCDLTHGYIDINAGYRT